MKRNIMWVSLLLVAAFVNACSSMSSTTGGGSGSLVSTLTQQLGVSETQAAGGTGAILALPQQKLAAGDFDQVAKAIPGADKYPATAKQILGGDTINAKDGLQTPFSPSGLGPRMGGSIK